MNPLYMCYNKQNQANIYTLLPLGDLYKINTFTKCVGQMTQILGCKFPLTTKLVQHVNTTREHCDDTSDCMDNIKKHHV